MHSFMIERLRVSGPGKIDGVRIRNLMTAELIIGS